MADWLSRNPPECSTRWAAPAFLFYACHQHCLARFTEVLSTLDYWNTTHLQSSLAWLTSCLLHWSSRPPMLKTPQSPGSGLSPLCPLCIGWDYTTVGQHLPSMWDPGFTAQHLTHKVWLIHMCNLSPHLHMHPNHHFRMGKGSAQIFSTKKQ